MGRRKNFLKNEMFPITVDSSACSPRMGRARWMSFGVIVTRWHGEHTVGVFKKTGLPCPLQSTNSCPLEAQICFEVLSNLSHQMLEGKFANQEFSGLLKTSNLMKCSSTRPVTMRFRHPSSRGRTPLGGFGSQLLPWCFATGGFADNLLCRSRRIETSLLTLLLRLQLGRERWRLRTPPPPVSYANSSWDHARMTSFSQHHCEVSAVKCSLFECCNQTLVHPSSSRFSSKICPWWLEGILPFAVFIVSMGLMMVFPIRPFVKICILTAVLP